MIENSQPDGSYVLSFGGKRIPFRIEHRRRKRLAITVHPDLRLEVVAPLGTRVRQFSCDSFFQIVPIDLRARKSGR